MSSPSPHRRHIGRFAVVGVVSTVLHLGLFAVLDAIGMHSQWANTTALILATLFNTEANRRWTFGVTGRGDQLKHHVQGLGVFFLTWAMTAGGLHAMDVALPDASVVAKTVAVGAATAFSTVVKYLAMRLWMFSSGSGSL